LNKNNHTKHLQRKDPRQNNRKLFVFLLVVVFAASLESTINIIRLRLKLSCLIKIAQKYILEKS